MFRLNSIDTDIAQSVTIKFSDQPSPVDGWPSVGTTVPIQFPPKITDDGKSGLWSEHNVKDQEPVVIYDGASPRKLGVEFTYVVTGGEFTTTKIADICRQFKAYFYRALKDTRMPIVYVSLYNSVGDEGTFRMLNVSISHGDTLILEGGTFPLLTKIKVDLALVTNIDSKMKIQDLPDKPRVEWY